MSISTGRAFESAVYEWVKAGVSDGTLGLCAKNVRVHLQYPLYSRDRESSIVFDVVVEVFRSSAPEPYLKWIWECKDYGHRVPVDDIEEFDSKLSQVGRNHTKGTIISSSGFQRGAINLAKSSGLGLVRVAKGISPDGELLADLGSVVFMAEVAPSPGGLPRLPVTALALAWKGCRSLINKTNHRTRAQVERADLAHCLAGEDDSTCPIVLQDSRGRLSRCGNVQELLKAVAGDLEKKV